MSRIGNKPVEIPEGVEVKIESGSVSVKGPKGALLKKIDRNISVAIKDKLIVLARSDNSKKIKALHGLYRALISNMVTGVTSGYQKVLELSGVGYRAAKEGKNLNIQIGFSHPVNVAAPSGIDFLVEGTNKIIVSGIDKELVGQVAADIKAIRPVEPYKAKGIKYSGQYVRRKAGKATSKVS